MNERYFILVYHPRGYPLFITEDEADIPLGFGEFDSAEALAKSHRAAQAWGYNILCCTISKVDGSIGSGVIHED